MCDDEVKGEFHFIVTKIYDSEGECIGISNSIVPGEYEPSEETKKYWEWLDKRRAHDQIQILKNNES